MSKTPFMPLWVSDFLGDTMDLDACEIGSYLLLLMAQWNRGGSISNDPAKLKRMARGGRNWPEVWAVIGRFFSEDAEGLFSKRLRLEQQNVAAKRIVNSQSGAHGAAVKALKRNNAAQANAGETLKRNASKPEPEPYIKEEPIGSSKKTARRKPEMELPPDWVPSDRNITDAEARQFSAMEIQDEADRFRNHHSAKGSRFRDWDAAWRTWLGNARKYGSRGSVAFGAAPGGHGRGGSIASIVARRWAAGEN